LKAFFARIPKRPTLRLIDEYFTAPQSGFKNAADYYEKCSSIKVLDQIRIPTLILCAMDDPVVDTSIYHYLEATQGIDFILTKHGGHVGFLGQITAGRPLRWMDEVVEKWIDFRLC
jgi:predicted alpha/beta-fold hydrolase